LPTLFRIATLVPVSLLALAPSRAGALAQAAEVIEDSEAYAVYASVLPIKFSSVDVEPTRITLFEETRSNLDCPRGNFGPNALTTLARRTRLGV
jgi:hypothetical protein